MLQKSLLAANMTLFFFTAYLLLVQCGSSDDMFTTQKCKVGENHCKESDCDAKQSRGYFCRCRDRYYVHAEACYQIPRIIVDLPYWGRSEIEPGNIVLMRCETGNYAPPHVIWEQDGRRVDNGASNSTLYIASFEDVNTGYYQCYTSSEGYVWDSPKSLRHKLYLSGAPPTPTIRIDPPKETFGVLFSLLCTPARGAVTWYKGGWPIIGARQAEVQFNPLGFRDAGKYVCQVKANGKSSLQSEPVDIGATTLTPKIVTEAYTFVPPGSRVLLQCSLDSFAVGKTGSAYEWTMVNITNDQTTMRGSSMDLILDDFSVDDVGDYRCCVYYNGVSQPSSPLALRVAENLPKVDVERVEGLMLGQSYIFLCWVCSSTHRRSDYFPLSWARGPTGRLVTEHVKIGNREKCSVSQNRFMIWHEVTVSAKDHRDLLTCNSLIGGVISSHNYTFNIVSHPNSLTIKGPKNGTSGKTNSWFCVADGGNWAAPEVTWLGPLPKDAEQIYKVENYTLPSTAMPIIRGISELKVKPPWKLEMILRCFSSHKLPYYGEWNDTTELYVDVYIPQLPQLPRPMQVVTEAEGQASRILTLGIVVGLVMVALSVHLLAYNVYRMKKRRRERLERQASTTQM